MPGQSTLKCGGTRYDCGKTLRIRSLFLLPAYTSHSDPIPVYTRRSYFRSDTHIQELLRSASVYKIGNAATTPLGKLKKTEKIRNVVTTPLGNGKQRKRRPQRHWECGKKRKKTESKRRRQIQGGNGKYGKKRKKTEKKRNKTEKKRKKNGKKRTTFLPSHRWENGKKRIL